MKYLAVLAALALAVILGACGGGSGTSSIDRTIAVDMVDIAFEPKTIEVKQGETIRFTFHNEGKLQHDAFIGNREAQADHEEDMRDGDEGHGHGGGDAITVKPGKTGELVHTFGDVGTIEIGCHEDGHYEQGMRIIVEVTT